MPRPSRPAPRATRATHLACLTRLVACAGAAAAVGAPAPAAGAQPPRVLAPRAVLRPPGSGGARVARVVGSALGAALGRAARELAREVRARRPAASTGAAATYALPSPPAPDTAGDPATDDLLRRTADEFADAASRGDTLHLHALVGAPGRLRPEVLAFFAARPRLGGPVTVAESADASGREHRTYYGYATPAAGGEPRPVVLTVTRDGGRPRVSGVLVDHLVVGRHR